MNMNMYLGLEGTPTHTSGGDDDQPQDECPAHKKDHDEAEV